MTGAGAPAGGRGGGAAEGGRVTAGGSLCPDGRLGSLWGDWQRSLPPAWPSCGHLKPRSPAGQVQAPDRPERVCPVLRAVCHTCASHGSSRPGQGHQWRGTRRRRPVLTLHSHMHMHMHKHTHMHTPGTTRSQSKRHPQGTPPSSHHTGSWCGSSRPSCPGGRFPLGSNWLFWGVTQRQGNGQLRVWAEELRSHIPQRMRVGRRAGGRGLRPVSAGAASRQAVSVTGACGRARPPVAGVGITCTHAAHRTRPASGLERRGREGPLPLPEPPGPARERPAP